LKPREKIIGAAILAAFVLWCISNRPVHRAPGVMVPDVPEQHEVTAPAPSFEKSGAAIAAQATFDIHARVLSRENYWMDSGAKLAPVDLALGWGRMSDSAVIEKLSISQFGRFYFWSASALPIPETEISQSSANMHLIPATSTIERAIKRVRTGDLVHFSGYLVNVQMPGGGTWNSSLTRNDAGAGACEVVWVEQFEIGPR
jgi:hypothetical protein